MPIQGNQRQGTARPSLVRFFPTSSINPADLTRWRALTGCTELSVLAIAVLAAAVR